MVSGRHLADALSIWPSRWLGLNLSRQEPTSYGGVGVVPAIPFSPKRAHRIVSMVGASFAE